MDEIADSKLKIIPNMKSKVVAPSNDQAYSLYYLNPMTQIVHVSLSIDNFSKNPRMLADILGISYQEIQIIIQSLISMNLVRKEYSRDGKNQRIVYESLENHIHLDRSSPLFGAWQAQLQLLGMQRKRSVQANQSYSFLAVFTATEDLRKRTIAKFTEFLKELQDEVKDAEPKHTYQIAFDLFPWS